jgi:chemotaxis protein methyltransferase CheR
VLRDRFLPGLLEQSPRLKAWSAACSTGEEPYTLAMILDDMGALDRASILATDIDEGVLARAKEGIYPERSVRDVPPRFAATYFTREDGWYRLSDKLKRAVRFERQNLLLDPFDEGFDLIICRNVIIYFTEEAKHMLYGKLARALRPGGVLFVGGTEQIFYPDRYGLEPAETFFYRRTV